MDRDEDIDNGFEAMLLNEQLSEGTIEQRLAEFGLSIEEALLVRQFQETLPQVWGLFQVPIKTGLMNPSLSGTCICH